MSSSNAPQGKVPTTLAILLLGLVITNILLASVPPVSRDALIHHLQIPKLYLQHGSFYEIPELIFSYYPMNLDLLYMGALYFGNDILPKYIHMIFGFATSFILYCHLKSRLPFIYACLGPLFFLSIPIIIKLSITAYVDLGLVFFSTATLLLLFKWIQKEFNTRYLLLAGFCCGFALGTKYNGLVIFFLLTLFIPVLYIRAVTSRRTGAMAIYASILFVFCALLAASPWLIRNSIWTGNPIYPLYDGFFNPGDASGMDPTTTKNSLKGVFAVRQALYGENIWQLLLLPVRIFFQGVDNDPRYFDGRLNPFLLLLPPFAFLYRSNQGRQIQLEKITLLVFCILYFLFAFNTSALRIRYLSPMVPFLVILAMYGLHNIETLAKRYITNKYIVLSVWLLPISLMLSTNGTYIYQQFKIINPVGYISGRLSRDTYISKYRPEYQVMKYANSHLSDSANILCVFMGWRGYYLNKKHVFDHHSNPELLLSWISEPDITINAVLKRLQKKALSHILIREDLTIQWVQHLSPSQQHVWKMLTQNHLSPLASSSGYTLFEIYPLSKELLLSNKQPD